MDTIPNDTTPNDTGAGMPAAAALHEADGAVLVDVRRAPIFEQAPTMIAGASWRDPAHVDDWAHDWPAGTRLVVYCVHGHQVSQGAALKLCAAGVDARFLQGGIEAWQAAGRAMVDKPARPLPP